MPSLGEAAAALMAADPWLRHLTLWSAVVGALFSGWAAWHTRAALRDLQGAHLNGLRRSVLRLHLVTQVGICACQVILVGVSVVMGYLPPVPWSMYSDHEGQLIITVIAGRKVARALTSLILFGISAHKVHWLHRYAR